MHKAAGNLGASLIAYEQSHERTQGRVAASAEDTVAMRDLAVSHERIGNVRVAQGDLPAAFRRSRRGRRLPSA